MKRRSSKILISADIDALSTLKQSLTEMHFNRLNFFK